jgi:hypothetical protein
MNAHGINRGKSGNVSARLRQDDFDGFLVTPTGLPYDRTTPADIVAMTLAGKPRGDRLPSSEWRFHRDIYRTRADANAIVHTHAPFATTLACHARGIPAFHYMVAVGGRPDIRCADYATFGTQATVRPCARRARRPPRMPSRASRNDRDRRRRSRTRSRWPSRSRRWPRCIGARWRSASREISPTRKWTSCSRSSRRTGSRGTAQT